MFAKSYCKVNEVCSGLATGPDTLPPNSGLLQRLKGPEAKAGPERISYNWFYLGSITVERELSPARGFIIPYHLGQLTYKGV